MLQYGYLLIFADTLIHSLVPVSARYCEGGHRCSPPKECCAQGCCYLYAPPSAPRMPPPNPSHMLNLFFMNHWFFWCVAMAIVIAILCACSLWRKRRQLCGWGSNGPHSQSGDSAGSIYAPPQYSRCSSFHHAPPPYREVTSKPDLYPLVFTCNADNGKNGSSYLMVQYFRNYIVRPTTGSLSATSTVDSLSSSFICNVNEANTLVPPPYSRAASPDLPLTIHDYSTLPRSASQQGCSLGRQQQQQRHHMYHLIPMSCSIPSNDDHHDVNTSNNTSDGDGSLSGTGSGSSAVCGSSASSSTASQMRTSESGNFQRMHSSIFNNSHNNKNNNSSITCNITKNSSDSIRKNETDSTILNMNMLESDHIFRNILNNVSDSNISITNNSDNDDVITDNQQLNSSSTIDRNKNNENNNNRSNNINYSIKNSRDHSLRSGNSILNQKPIDSYVISNSGNDTERNPYYKYGNTSSKAIYNSCKSTENVNATISAASSKNNLNYKELDVLRRSLEACCQILDKQQQQKQESSSSNFSEESPFNMDILKKYGCMRSYINSVTGSVVSSLTNIGSPGSPPQATSPTAEARELFQQIRQFQGNDDCDTDPSMNQNTNSSIIAHESYKNVPQMQPMKRPSSLHHHLTRKSTHRVGGFFPITTAKNSRSPCGSNSALLTFARSRRGFISRSAPTTPGTSVTSSFLNDDSPLLNEQDEDAEHNT